MTRTENHVWDSFITKYLLYTTNKFYTNYECSSLTINSTLATGDSVEIDFTYHDYENNEYTNYTTTLPVESIVDWIERNKEGIERYDLLSELCPLNGNDTVTVQLNCGWFIQAVRSGNEVAYNFYDDDGDHKAEVVVETKTVVVTSKVDYLYA